MEDAMLKHRNADVLVNFASLRSAYDSTIETLNYPQVNIKLKVFSFIIFNYAVLIDKNHCYYC